MSAAVSTGVPLESSLLLAGARVGSRAQHAQHARRVSLATRRSTDLATALAEMASAGSSSSSSSSSPSSSNGAVRSGMSTAAAQTATTNGLFRPSPPNGRVSPPRSAPYTSSTPGSPPQSHTHNPAARSTHTAPGPPGTSSQSTSATATLRARRASVSKGAATSPTSLNNSNGNGGGGAFGLGLMLDSEASNGAHGGGTSVGGTSPVVGGSASARARDMMIRLGLDTNLAHDAQSTSPAPSPTSDPTEWRGRIPRVSSNASGSPLLVYTGTTPLLSSSSSANHNAHSSFSRSSSPSHLTPKSSSVAMDRSSSGSSQRSSSDHHGRHVSLTSACPPATSNILSPALSEFHSTSPVSGASKAYWGRGGGMDDDDPRRGAKASSAPGPIGNFLSLPSNLLSLFLAPLVSSTSNPNTAPNGNGGGGGGLGGNGGAGPTKKAYPFPVRVLTFLYLVFSCVFLAVKILSPTSSSSVLGGDGKRLDPRGQEILAATGGLTKEDEDARRFVLGRMGEEVNGWAQKVAGGVGWPKGKTAEPIQEPEQVDEDDTIEEQARRAELKKLDEQWGTVKRIGNPDGTKATGDNNPLTSFTHPYRFAKMHDKLHWELPDEIEPFLFRAAGAPPATTDVTACLYTNEVWLSHLPSFIAAWRGPVSLVFEVAHSRSSPLRSSTLSAIEALRADNSLVRQWVDFHLVGAPKSASERTLNKTRERLITRPTALNFHTNLARFFATTDIIYIVGDARIVPSKGLRTRLRQDNIRDLVMTRGDAVVVPTFGFVRDLTGQGLAPTNAGSLREEIGLHPSDIRHGVGEEEYSAIGEAYVSQLRRSVPLAEEEWPQKKQTVVTMVRTRVGTPDRPSDSTMALFDRRWDLNHGPTNWYLWRKWGSDARLLEPPELGGGIGLGVDGAVGGGKDVFRVTDYDLHYSPAVVVSRKGQPWCTERFENMPAACVYQMYLSGAEMWVLPDEWQVTIEVIDRIDDKAKPDPAEKLKNSISARLYGKFHQEACMHYGREFLSVQMWDSDKAQHLRSVCARTLGVWGMGTP